MLATGMGYMGPADGAACAGICVREGSSQWGVPREAGLLWGQPCSGSGGSCLQWEVSGAAWPETSARPSQDLGLFLIISSFLDLENSLTTRCRSL